MRRALWVLLLLVLALPAAATTIKRGPGGGGGSSVFQATDCATVTNAPSGSMCADTDNNALYVCEAPGPCGSITGWTPYVSAGGLASTDIDQCAELSTLWGTEKTGTCGKLVLSTSPTFTTPVLGVASATSLATSAASPLLLTNGQLVTIALTAQTVGGATLTIPDFASVSDEFVFKTKSVVMTNKELTTPVITSAAAPSTTVAGQIGFDNNSQAAGRGTIQVYDGTANTYLVGVLASDTPSNGQVPTWNTGGTVTWEAGGGTLADESVSEPKLNTGAGAPSPGLCLQSTAGTTVTWGSCGGGGTEFSTMADGGNLCGSGQYVIRNAADSGYTCSPTGWKDAYTTAATQAGINAAVTQCGGGPCTIHLQAGTYDNICWPIYNYHAPLRVIGAGQGVTILRPNYANLDACVGTTSQGQMIQLADDTKGVEFAYFTIDGNKTATPKPTCPSGECGSAIWSQYGSSQPNTQIWIHDLEIKNMVGSAVLLGQSTGAVVENNVMSDLGCHQTDSVCGNGAGHQGWDAASDIASISGRKGDGFGVQVTIGNSYSKDTIIRNNSITRAVKHGIEVFGSDGAGECADLSTASDACFASSTQIINNTVTSSSEGIVVNTGAHVEIRNNHLITNGQTNATGEIGTGISITGRSRDIEVVDNNVITGQSAGITIQPSMGGNVVVRGNQISGNCTGSVFGGGATDRGALYVLSSNTTVSTMPHNVELVDNTVLNNPLCQYALWSYYQGGSPSGFLGLVKVTGGKYDTPATNGLGSVKLDNPNLYVNGVKITGNLSFGALTSGIAVNNEVSGSTTYTAGSTLMNLDAGAMTVRGALTATSVTVSPSATPAILFDDSVATDAAPEAQIVADAVSDDNGQISLQVEGNADGTYREGFNLKSTAGTVAVVVGGPNVSTITGTTSALSAPLAVTVATGTITLTSMSSIASAACHAVKQEATGTTTNVLTTDVVSFSFNGDVSAVTGYTPATTGAVIIYVYPTAGHVNAKVCNPTSSSITPGDITLNYRVTR